MTIALTVKVHAGVVLAADSATTFSDTDRRPEKVYYNAQKVFRLHSRAPVGAATWGLGSVGDYSIEMLARLLRRRLEDHDDPFHLDEAQYTVEEVAHHVRSSIFEDLYQGLYGGKPEPRPSLGFVIAGYSADANFPEEWVVLVNEAGECLSPERLRGPGDFGFRGFGQYDSVNRLVNGLTDAYDELAEFVGIDQEKVAELREVIEKGVGMAPVRAHMPIRDAIELAQFLVRTEIGFHRFSGKEPAPTVGGAMEVAALTRTHGFQWVSHANPYRGSTENETEPDPDFVRAIPKEL